MNSEFVPNTAFKVSLGQTADFDLGGMRVMPARRQVRFREETRTLEPRVMQVLVALAETRPDVVSRDQLALACWGGLNIGDDAINRCIVALRRLAREFEPQPFAIETVARVGYSLREAGAAEPATGKAERELRRRWRLIFGAAAIAGVILLAAGLFAWHPWRSSTISVAVVPASDASETQAIARDLTAKLGMLNSVSEGGLRLIDKPGVRGDLLFQVDSSTDAGMVETNLVLLNDRHDVLWSTTRRRAQANLADLKQQLAYTAGTVLQCAKDALSDRSNGPDRQTLKTYLGACEGYAEISEDVYRDLRAAFARVIEKSPRFEAGWRKLLTADSEIVRDLNFQDAVAESDRAQLKQDIAAARRLYPDIAEAYLGESVLLPARDFAGRMRLADRAVDEAPEKANPLVSRARILVQAGRISQSLDDIKRAVRLDPLSPSMRQELVVGLAAAGRMGDAQQELRKAEALWPGAASLLEARYLIHLRFGDPREAMRLRDSGLVRVSGMPLHGSFLEARANPTPANIEKALRDNRSYFASTPLAIVNLAQALAAFGREDELFAVLLDGRQPYDADDLLEVISRPAFRNFHQDPRFMRVAARLGLVDDWRSSGNWPDFCFDPDLRYDCKREAARIASAQRS
jgi:DNA-binding winged helix-turn-helix (wHTH) protein/tetratricopeptide (TPR) repeat protein